MDDKDTYLQEFEQELYELSLKVDALKIYIFEECESTIDKEVIDLLGEKQEEAYHKLEALKTAENDLWDEDKQEMQDIIEDIGETIKYVQTI